MTAPRFDSLETRRMLDATPSATFTAGTLYVNTTDAAETVSFSIKGQRLYPLVNGLALGKFSLGATQRIEIQAFDGSDVVDLSNLSIPTYVNAGLGNDLVIGGLGNDSLTGAAGKDTLRGGPGDDRLSGGNTSDQLFGESGNDVIYGGFGDDYAEGGANKNRFFGEEGNDTLVGGKNSDGMYAGGGADLLFGGLGNDILSGDGGNDKLLAGAGDDLLYGGKGSDWMWGEEGNDYIDSADGAVDRLIDGGEGDDEILADETGEVPQNAELVKSPEPPPQPPPAPVGGDLAKAVSFGDEAIWSQHFDSTAQKLKDMGVKVARLWLEVRDVAERPNAWDNVSQRDIVVTWKGVPNAQRPVIGGLAMKRAFQLKAMGFKVILTVSIHSPVPPTDPQLVTDFFNFLKNSTRYQNGTGGTLKDAVDAWEVNQEVDLASNWEPSATDRVVGMQKYVELELIPAAVALHAGPVEQWEKIISSSVSFRPSDLAALLEAAAAHNALNAIDYAGYHPYGQYDPSVGINQVKERVDGAVAVAAQYNKPLAATEWNVRGYPRDGTRDAEWAAAIDKVYRDYIAPNFGMAVYYTVANDFQPRGGNTSARPAGLFKHDTLLTVSTSSTIDEMLAWYETPLIPSDPFYTTFKTLIGATNG